jgi:hypothetical protein
VPADYVKTANQCEPWSVIQERRKNILHASVEPNPAWRCGDIVVARQEAGDRNDGKLFWDGTRLVDMCFRLHENGSNPLQCELGDFPLNYWSCYYVTCELGLDSPSKSQSRCSAIACNSLVNLALPDEWRHELDRFARNPHMRVLRLVHNGAVYGIVKHKGLKAGMLSVPLQGDHGIHHALRRPHGIVHSRDLRLRLDRTELLGLEGIPLENIIYLGACCPQYPLP